jgi:predicted nucleic acid-binding protein
VILIDSTPLVALCDRKDALHLRAVRDLDRLARQRFVVSDAVLAEALHLLPEEPSRLRLAHLVASLPIGVLRDEHPDESRIEAFRWLAQYAEHKPDWADATLVIASSKDKKVRVWTYDSEFKTTWRRPNGTRVPLADR